MSEGHLHRYFLNNSDKTIFKWLHYLDIYEEVFSRFRGKPVTMLEIGVLGGGSLQMWKDYFGPQCRIVGLDINEDCKQHASEGIDVRIGSQNDKTVLQSLIQEYEHFDIVLDDGSHVMEHMITAFETLYPAVSSTGVYLVEDTHTCYRPNYGGGLRREGSFIEHAKDKIDALNAEHSLGQVPTSDFTRTTQKISFY